jgi:hypothetical protein
MSLRREEDEIHAQALVTPSHGLAGLGAMGSATHAALAGHGLAWVPLDRVQERWVVQAVRPPVNP